MTSSSGPAPAHHGDDASATAPALEAVGLGLHGRDGWALRDGSFTVPRGRVVGLVGPNGAGKSSLVAVAAGLRPADAGVLRVLGHVPGSPAVLPRIGTLFQDRPLERRFTVAETLRLGRDLNPNWNDAAARAIVDNCDVPLKARVGRLSTGQRTCVALALALGKQPDLLLLDEPMADLDPQRRRALTGALMTRAAEHGTTIVMSTHTLSELHLVCDYVLLTARGRILIADDTEFVQAAHSLITYTCPAPAAPSLPPQAGTVIETRRSGRVHTALVCFPLSTEGAASTSSLSLEEILLAYLRNPQASPLIAGSTRDDAPSAGTPDSHERPTQ
ncbi:ATP-binding cassette domain-containing protein [Streptomyces aurantiacus]|uniref:ABC transporter ATP-binding protein n=1 Tax=Streptomyces aurantiacus TaxID=47760 RepID=A0A7G1NUU2_9ACTN|nr:ABC transporter ATP-binding protein [Streptomyces aurantiacus]BCL26639.1 ABC transporter ATP-binding protein [Streptomyces aurantiacus]